MATFYSISAADMVSKWYGESEKHVRQLFQTARLNKPSIIFIDEVDSFARCRTDNDVETSRRVKNELLCQMDGTMDSSDGLFVIGATNMPFQLDAAFLRRFHERIYFPLPNKEDRMELFKKRFCSYNCSNDNFELLASRTEG